MKPTISTSFLSTLVMAVLAAPVSDPTGGLVVRQFDEEEKNWIWKNPDDITGDRVEVTIGRGRTSFGHLVPSSNLQKINTDCSASSCQPGTTLRQDTYYVGKQGWGPREVAMNVDASFKVEGVGSKADMLKLAKIALDQVYSEGIVERKQGVSYPTPGACPPSRTPGCPKKLNYVDQWIGISHLHVKIKSVEDATKAKLNIGWSLESDDGLDACAMLTATGVGMGLVGAISGAVGTGVALDGILCGAGF